MVTAFLTNAQVQRNMQQLVYAGSGLGADQQVAINDRIDTVNGDLTTLQDTVTTHTDDLTTLNTTVSDHTAELADHETRIAALEGP